MYPMIASLILFYSLHHAFGEFGKLWDIDNGLEDRMFNNPVIKVVSRTERSCVVTCMATTNCVMVTFNKDTGICRGHSAYFTLDDPSSHSPGTAVWKSDPCYPYTYDVAAKICYKVMNAVPTTYNQLKDACAANEATLPVLNTKEKQDAIANVITFHLGRKYYWVGGSDTQAEGVWRWWNGEAMNMSNAFWNPSEPNDYYLGIPGEDCAVLEAGAKLNDVPCDVELYGICQKHI